jgi:hypothetical protein
MLVVHGTHDSLIPIDEARAFVEALRQGQRAAGAAFARLHGARACMGLVLDALVDSHGRCDLELCGALPGRHP